MCRQLNQESSLVLLGDYWIYFFLLSQAFQSLTFFISEASNAWKKCYLSTWQSLFHHTGKKTNAFCFNFIFFFFCLGIITIVIIIIIIIKSFYASSDNYAPLKATTHFWVACTNTRTHQTNNTNGGKITTASSESNSFELKFESGLDKFKTNLSLNLKFQYF